MTDLALSDPAASAATEALDDAPEVPPVADVLTALGGFLVLSACAGVGSGDLAVAGRGLPSGILVQAGALVLTGPGLLVGHQFLGLGASPDALLGSVARAFVRAGRLALGLSPFLLYFSATSGLWLLLFCVLLSGIGVAGLSDAARSLVAAEARTRPSMADLLKMRALVVAWGGLTVLVALRIAYDVLHLVLG